jgi:hypothetical protein
MPFMRILPWRAPRSRYAQALSQILSRAVGEYAGRARYHPRGYTSLNRTLSRAVGKIVELQFAGMAPLDEPFAGQALYRERGGRGVLGDHLIPEQDLHFLD